MADSQKYTPKGEDVIRTEVINEIKGMGYDPELEENKPLLDSLIKKELAIEAERVENHKKLSKAIEQKINLRNKLNGVVEEEDLDEDGEPKPKGDNTQQPTGDDKLSKLEKEIEDLKHSQHRQKYPNLTDEEYHSINALAKETGKSFEDTIANNPIAKTYFENSEAKERLNGAMREPSNRPASSSNQLNEEEQIAQDMARMAGNGLKVSGDFLKK